MKSRKTGAHAGVQVVGMPAEQSAPAQQVEVTVAACIAIVVACK